MLCVVNYVSSVLRKDFLVSYIKRNYWKVTNCVWLFFLRIKIMQNIGVAFVKMGQFSDAVTSFEHIMGEKASFQTGMMSEKTIFQYLHQIIYHFDFDL